MKAPDSSLLGQRFQLPRKVEEPQHKEGGQEPEYTPCSVTLHFLLKSHTSPTQAGEPAGCWSGDKMVTFVSHIQPFLVNSRYMHTSVTLYVWQELVSGIRD